MTDPVPKVDINAPQEDANALLEDTQIRRRDVQQAINTATPELKEFLQASVVP